MDYYIGGFSDIKPTLHSWVKSHLTTVFNPFHLLLYLVCSPQLSTDLSSVLFLVSTLASLESFFFSKNRVAREILKPVRSIAQHPGVNPLLGVRRMPFQCLPSPPRTVLWSSSPSFHLSLLILFWLQQPHATSVHEQIRPVVILQCLHTLPFDTHKTISFLPSCLCSHVVFSMSPAPANILKLASHPCTSDLVNPVLTFPFPP